MGGCSFPGVAMVGMVVGFILYCVGIRDGCDDGCPLGAFVDVPFCTTIALIPVSYSELVNGIVFC